MVIWYVLFPISQTYIACKKFKKQVKKENRIVLEIVLFQLTLFLFY